MTKLEHGSHTHTHTPTLRGTSALSQTACLYLDMYVAACTHASLCEVLVVSFPRCATALYYTPPHPTEQRTHASLVPCARGDCLDWCGGHSHCHACGCSVVVLIPSYPPSCVPFPCGVGAVHGEGIVSSTLSTHARTPHSPYVINIAPLFKMEPKTENRKHFSKFNKKV